MLVVSHRGRQLTFEPFDGDVAKALSNHQLYEREMLQYIEALRLPGAYVDVGAHVGTHALFFALFCPAARVHAFEPVDRFFAMLGRNVAANGAGDRIQLHQVGLSDRTETSSLHFENQDFTIHCRPLDEVVVDEPVSLIKADVEGMEDRVLGGARRILTQYRPLLFIEAHNQQRLDALVALLAPYGYRLTGRVFNNTPTYELACPDSPAIPRDCRLRVRSLLQPDWWPQPESPLLVISRAGGALHGDAAVPDERHVYLVHDGESAEVPPAGNDLLVSPAAPCFLQVNGSADPTLSIGIFVTQYGLRGRVDTRRFSFHPRSFHEIELQPGVRRVRVSFRITGTGSFRIERLEVHAGDDPETPVAVDELAAGAPVIEWTAGAALPRPAGETILIVDQPGPLVDAGGAAALAGVGWQIERTQPLLGRNPWAVVLRPAVLAGAQLEAENLRQLRELQLRLREDEIGALAGRLATAQARIEEISKNDQRSRRELAARSERLTAEIDRLRPAYQRLARANDAVRAEAASQRKRADQLERRIKRLHRRLIHARTSLSFRLGRATKVAARQSSSNLWAAPRRWLETFRGTDEILAEVERELATVSPRAARAAGGRQVEAVEREVMVAGLIPPEGPAVAGIAGSRLAVELAAAARFRPLSPGTWRHLVDQAPPSYLLVTSDGLAAGTPWNQFGTPGGRGGVAALAELVDWCRSRGIPAVYWDTLGTPRPRLGIPRGVRFDAVFSVSPRACHLASEELDWTPLPLAPAVEPLVVGPEGVGPATPDHPIFVGEYDRRTDPGELARLEALLRAALPRGLEILDTHRASRGPLAPILRLPPELEAVSRRRPPARDEAAAIRSAGLLLCGGAGPGADFPSWTLLRGIALGANIVSVPTAPGDARLTGAVAFAATPAEAVAAVDRMMREPRLGAGWRSACDRVLADYSLRERLDEVARRCGVAPVSTGAAAVVASPRTVTA